MARTSWESPRAPVFYKSRLAFGQPCAGNLEDHYAFWQRLSAETYNRVTGGGVRIDPPLLTPLNNAPSRPGLPTSLPRVLRHLAVRA